MAVIEREFEAETEEATVTIEIDDDADRVTVNRWDREPVVVDVEDDVAIIDEPVPDWAEKPLAQMGVCAYEYQEDR